MPILASLALATIGNQRFYVFDGIRIPLVLLASKNRARAREPPKIDMYAITYRIQILVCVELVILCAYMHIYRPLAQAYRGCLEGLFWRRQMDLPLKCH